MSQSHYKQYKDAANKEKQQFWEWERKQRKKEWENKVDPSW